MMRVFIGGSRAISVLNEAIRARLDDLIQRKCSILVGDANGADKAVQQFFAERGYADVTVYCTGDSRNNVGAWPVHRVTPPHGRKDFLYYAAKDAEMARNAGCGVMLWDGKSKGTLQNVKNLLGAGKRTLVWLAPAAEFQVVATDEELGALLDRGSAGGSVPRRTSLADLLDEAQTNGGYVECDFDAMQEEAIKLLRARKSANGLLHADVEARPNLVILHPSEDKLREAHFFLSLMRLHSEEYEMKYFLSAFLSAVNSVTEPNRLHSTDTRFKEWYRDVANNVVATSILPRLTALRNKEIHHKGTRTVQNVGFSRPDDDPLVSTHIEFTVDFSSGSPVGTIKTAEMSEAEPVQLTNEWFWDVDGSPNVFKTCEEALEVLEHVIRLRQLMKFPD